MQAAEIAKPGVTFADGAGAQPAVAVASAANCQVARVLRGLEQPVAIAAIAPRGPVGGTFFALLEGTILTEAARCATPCALAILSILHELIATRCGPIREGLATLFDTIRDNCANVILGEFRIELVDALVLAISVIHYSARRAHPLVERVVSPEIVTDLVSESQPG